MSNPWSRQSNAIPPRGGAPAATAPRPAVTVIAPRSTPVTSQGPTPQHQRDALIRERNGLATRNTQINASLGQLRPQVAELQQVITEFKSVEEVTCPVETRFRLLPISEIRYWAGARHRGADGQIAKGWSSFYGITRGMSTLLFQMQAAVTRLTGDISGLEQEQRGLETRFRNIEFELARLP